jgi:cyanophycinase
MMAGGTGIGGDSNGAAARKGMIDVVAGFGLLQDIIIDQHFSQRGRLGRLLSVFAGTPGLIGIGLDEDTAVLIDREGTLEALGSNMVTLVDGRNTVSDYFDRQNGEVLTITGSSLHVLADSRHFDLDARRVIGIETP